MFSLKMIKKKTLKTDINKWKSKFSGINWSAWIVRKLLKSIFYIFSLLTATILFLQLFLPKKLIAQ